MTEDKLLVDVFKAAELLSISTSKLYKCAEKKEIPSLKIGTRLLFCVETLQDWIKEQENKI
jgi:excisionase family DNA binding protein